MCPNDWKNEFSVLIDVEGDFSDHFYWEFRLASTLKKTLQGEIDCIKDYYKDLDVSREIAHFTSLLVDIIYTREHQENISIIVQKIHVF